MIGLIQRAVAASVTVDGAQIARIGKGIVLFLGIQAGDSESQADRLAERVLGYRIFPDAAQKMNLSLLDIGAQLLVVSQFTLAADTRKGMRAGFSKAAAPAEGERLYRYFLERVRKTVAGGAVRVAEGRFGADMHVNLTNDGPVTFWLEVSPEVDNAGITAN